MKKTVSNNCTIGQLLASLHSLKERDSKSRQREEIREEGLYDDKNLEDIDVFYPDMFSVCGESESDGELWYRLGP